MVAVRADQPPATQRDSHRDRGDAEGDVGDVHPVKAEKAVECSGDAHGQVTSEDPGAENPAPWSRPVRVTRTPLNVTRAQLPQALRRLPAHTRVRRAPNQGFQYLYWSGMRIVCGHP